MELDQIEKYINTLADDELEFKNPGHSSFSGTTEAGAKGQIRILGLLRFIRFFFYSAVDFVELYLKLKLKKSSLRGKSIVYTEKNFCSLVDGKLFDRVLKPLFTDNVIFINYSKEFRLQQINDQKVYNIGGLVRLLSAFYANKNRMMRFFRAYTIINNGILGNLNHNNVYMLLFYNLNGLSLAFSRFRKNITLIEVQHGSIINYPPYIKPAPVKVADIFYIKNQATIDYLKTHLCLNFSAEYRLIPYSKGKQEFVPGIHVLYASTFEFNGLHPIMQKFLSDFQSNSLDLIIRLHPREKEKEHLFAQQLGQHKIDYRFDRSENWLEGNTIQNLIVISPWSSTIEDSYDNGFSTIIIDPVGRERYAHLIDNKRCFYSNDLSSTIETILSQP